MAYSYHLLFSQVDRLLSTKPRMTLLRVAEELNVGTHTLSRSVRQFTGKSFCEYQKAKILERTCCLIATDAALLEKQIAAQIGYSSPDSFARFIKRTTGVCMREFRQKRHEPA